MAGPVGLAGRRGGAEAPGPPCRGRAPGQNQKCGRKQCSKCDSSIFMWTTSGRSRTDDGGYQPTLCIPPSNRPFEYECQPIWSE